MMVTILFSDIPEVDELHHFSNKGILPILVFLTSFKELNYRFFNGLVGFIPIIDKISFRV